jgi:hypothetical protein
MLDGMQLAYPWSGATRRQRWDTYEEMATCGAAHFPADARKARQEGK